MSSNRNSASRPDSGVSVGLAGEERGGEKKGREKGMKKKRRREVQGGGF